MKRAIALFITALAAVGAHSAAAAPAAQGALQGYQLVDTWRTRAAGGVIVFTTPGGLETASDDTVYAVDRGAKKVYHVDAAGRQIDSFSVANGQEPIDVAVTASRVYVISRTAGEVHTRTGALVGAWSQVGMTGIGTGADGKVYVSRLGSGAFGAQAVVDVRDAGGTLLETWSDTAFVIQKACGLDVGADGRVYMAADGGVYVWKDKKISGLLRVRTAIEGPLIGDVDIDAQGRLYGVQTDVSDDCLRVPGADGGQRLVTWGADGKYVGETKLGGGMWLSSGPGAGLVVTVSSGNYNGIQRLTDRAVLTSGFTPFGTQPTALGRIVRPSRVSVADNGAVFLSDFPADQSPAAEGRIQRWSAAGEPESQWDTPLVSDVAGGADAGPCTLTDTKLACLSAGAAARWSLAITPDMAFTAVDGAGALTAGVDIGRQLVFVFDAAGAVAQQWPIPSARGFSVISDIAIDASNLYLADRTGREVGVYAHDGTRVRGIVVPGGAVRVSTAGGFLYALSGDGWVWKYDAAGVLAAAFQPIAPDPAGRTVLPADIAAEPGGRIYVADPTNDRILVFAPGGPPPTNVPAVVDTKCSVTVDKRAAPAAVKIGEPVTVALLANGDCPQGDGRIDVALVIDRSGSMAGPAIVGAKNGALAFLGELAPGAAQVALVAFSTSADVLQPLTGAFASVVKGVRQLVPAGQTAIHLGLEAGLSELEGPSARAGVPKVVVLMTDGRPSGGRTDTVAAADQIRAKGITIYTIGLGPDIDTDLLKSIASSPDRFYAANSELDLAAVYADIGRRISVSQLFRTATVHDVLPADMRYEPNSAVPPAAWDDATRTLTWQLTDVPISGMRLTYTVRPNLPGHRPTNEIADVQYVDVTGADGAATFPIPEVEVSRISRWFLPIAQKSVCRPQRADIVMAIDTSSSMLEPSGPGSRQNKLQVSIDAVRTFMAQMAFPEDQAAIVTFDSLARTVQPLTGARGALEVALNGIRNGSGTRIDLGLNQAIRELITSRHKKANATVIVLLTDGHPTPGTEAAVLTAAKDARSLAFTVYTVGLGSDFDATLMRQVAGSSSRAFAASDGAALRQIYTLIAGKALCR
ncbi:MAG: VWA domain-containing protein [Ardenticatenales bacterium]